MRKDLQAGNVNAVSGEVLRYLLTEPAREHGGRPVLGDVDCQRDKTVRVVARADWETGSTIKR
jgi:hypothetical protein